jgi:hypothetical protein
MTLAEFNEQRYQDHLLEKSWLRSNNISCPTCGKELFDSGQYILTCNPPKRTVICQACGFTGHRYV